MTDTPSLLRLRAAELLDPSDEPVDHDVAAELEALAFCYLSVAGKLEDEQDTAAAPPDDLEIDALAGAVALFDAADASGKSKLGLNRLLRPWRMN